MYPKTGMCLRQGGRWIFSQKNFPTGNFFEKKNYHAAAGERGLSFSQRSGLNIDRVTRVTEAWVVITYYEEPTLPFESIAIDYDGTLAWQGVVAEQTQQALVNARQMGLRLVLVTGRMVDDLLRVFPQLGLFDLVVSENGAVLYEPASTMRQALGPSAPRQLIDALEAHDIPFATGQVMIAINRVDESRVLDLIATMNLDLRIIGNKADAMILPRDINKATGLTSAQQHLGLRAESAIGIGDAENDLELFQACGLRVAVANALDVLKEQADLVMEHANGTGVVEFIRDHLPVRQGHLS